MTTDTTLFARQALGMRVHDTPHAPGLLDMVGVAIRQNPRRAHLLVSKVLGKHTPAHPQAVHDAAHRLAERTAAALPGAYTDVVVVGFAEAASALGAQVAASLQAYYVCSTRRPTHDAYIEFEESHSHASHHHLAPKDPYHLNNPAAVVVLVDDELTSGNTAMNMISGLHAKVAHPRYIIATLADLRTETDRERLAAFSAELNVPVTVVSMFAASVDVPEDVQYRAAEVLTRESKDASDGPYTSAPDVRILPAAHFASAAEGIDASAREILAMWVPNIARSVNVERGQRTLVLGVEEDMHVAAAVALRLSEDGMHVKFSSTTRSPAAVLDVDGYPLHSVVRITQEDEAPRFVYNVNGEYEHIVIVTTDPRYASLADATAAGLATQAPRVTLLRVDSFQALNGPTFGSYDAGDVTWLLKDLSDVDLEASLEDREERVANGAHYAESLPVEYEPSREYMALFEQALASNAQRVADDVVRLGQQIGAARSGEIVLVSLARAGTPIGVLLQRYLRGRGRSVRHYTISIVRGRGIDHNALRYISTFHDPGCVVFVDGWTGKGAIARELNVALDEHELLTGVTFPRELAVLADTGECAQFYGSRDDYLIPSAALNSTVSGLVSRTVLNDLIGPHDFHGAKFYDDLSASDVSRRFVDTVASQFREVSRTKPEPVTWAAWAEVERLSTAYGIGNVNLVKPGVGETTRVLLRRVPWKVLVKAGEEASVPHILELAAARGVPIELVPDLRFTAVGLIHLAHTKGATDETGRAVEARIAAA